MLGIFKHDCNKHGHRFKPRYTEVMNKVHNVEVNNVSLESLRKLLVTQKYVYDVCEYCGKISGDNKPDWGNYNNF